MTTTLIQLHYCDACQTDHSRASTITQWTSDDDALGRALTIDLGLGPRELDMCKACESPLAWLDMMELYSTVGRPVRAVGRQAKATPKAAPREKAWDARTFPREYPCLFCQESFTDNAPLVTHLHSEHGLDFNSLPRRCPLCGITMPVANAKTMIGVQRHCASVHGKSMPATWRQARDEGDPHGMVAELEAAIT